MKHCLFAAVLLLWLMPQFSRAQSAASPEIAMIVALQGAATARHPGAAPRPLALYSPLFAGDVVAVGAGGRVTARFAGGQSRTLTAASPLAVRRLLPPPAASDSALARLQRAVFDAQCSAYSRASRNVHTAVRGGAETPPLQALRPRRRILRSAFVFHWASAAPGPVRLSLFDGDGKPLWSRDGVTGDHLVYPADAPPLAAGQDYQWLVSQGAAGSSDEAQFETATDEVEQKTTIDLAALSHVAFAGEEDRCLARASLLVQNRLLSDVVSTLEALPAAQQSPLTHAILLEAWTALGDTDMADHERAALGDQPPAVCRQWETQP